MANIPSRAWPSKHRSAYPCQLVPDSLQLKMILLLSTYPKSRTYKPDLCFDINVNTHTHIQSLCAFSYLCAVHKQRVNDPVSPLPAAHSLHAAVVLSECEMCFCAIIHKLPLQVQIRPTCQLWSWPICRPMAPPRGAMGDHGHPDTIAW